MDGATSLNPIEEGVAPRRFPPRGVVENDGIEPSAAAAVVGKSPSGKNLKASDLREGIGFIVKPNAGRRPRRDSSLILQALTAARSPTDLDLILRVLEKDLKLHPARGVRGKIDRLDVFSAPPSRQPGNFPAGQCSHQKDGRPDSRLEARGEKNNLEQRDHRIPRVSSESQARPQGRQPNDNDQKERSNEAAPAHEYAIKTPPQPNGKFPCRIHPLSDLIRDSIAS